MSIASTLSGKLSIKHPQLGVLCREDGAILMRCKGGNANKCHYTFGHELNRGYRQVRIKGNNYFVHRLIAEAFIPNVRGVPFVDHISRNRKDNSVTNLRWVTSKENNDNSSRVINRNPAITVRRCDNKNEYERQRLAVAALEGKRRLNMRKPDGSPTCSGLLPEWLYHKLEPLSQRERFLAYTSLKKNHQEEFEA